jgi:hypothetical protein
MRERMSVYLRPSTRMNARIDGSVRLLECACRCVYARVSVRIRYVRKYVRMYVCMYVRM